MSGRGQRARILVNALSLVQGGGRTYVVNLLRELERDSRGFDFTILTAEGRLSREEARSARLWTVRLPGQGSLLATAFRVLYEEALLPARARAFDLLYCVADVSPAWGRVPTVVALRNLNIYDRRFDDTLRLRTLERLAQLGTRRAARVIFPSQAAADTISARLGIPSDRYTVVPHGISMELFPPEGRRIHSERPYLFVPCVTEPHKNLETAIRGLAALSRSDVELWIAGGSGMNPEHRPQLEALARELGLADRVRFLGGVPYGEMAAYYRGATALLFPSRLETFGHPLLESMLVGTPVLASDLPVFHEVAGDAALYFHPERPAELARRAQQLLEDGADTARRVSLGLDRARSFSWQRSVDTLCAVFDDVLTEHERWPARGRQPAA